MARQQLQRGLAYLEIIFLQNGCSKNWNSKNIRISYKGELRNKKKSIYRIKCSQVSQKNLAKDSIKSIWNFVWLSH